MTHFNDMNIDERAAFIDQAMGKVVTILESPYSPESDKALIDILKVMAKPADDPDKIIKLIRDTCLGGFENLNAYLTFIYTDSTLSMQTIALMSRIIIEGTKAATNGLLDTFTKYGLFNETVERFIIEQTRLSAEQANALNALIADRT